MSAVTVENRGPVTFIRINRPEKMNAISNPVAAGIQAAMQAFDRSDQRVAILSSAGERAFSAGADVTDIPELWRCIPNVGFKTSKPLIAATTGWCVGGAVVMVMMCDLMVSTEDTIFYYPEAKLGLTGGMAGTAVAIAGLGLWLAVFPAVAKGPDALMSPEMAQVFFSDIAEMKPVGSIADGLTFLTPGLIALGVLVFLAWRDRSAMVLYAAVCTLVTLVLAFLHLRFSTYPALIGVAVLPVALTAAGGIVPVRLALLAGFLLVPPAAAALGAHNNPAADGPSCPVAAVAPLLAPYAGEVIIADPNETPELLYNTGMKTVGSLYHRNAAAFIRLRDAWRSMPGTTVPDAVRAARATLILICPRPQQRSPLVKDLPAGTLRDVLDAGVPPPWLSKAGGSARPG